MTENEGPSELTLDALRNVSVKISVVLGTRQMLLHELLKLSRGSVVELNSSVGDRVDLYVNNKLVARGEIVLVDDKIGVTLTEIVPAGLPEQ